MIEYLKTKMGIKRPYLFLLTMALCGLLGALGGGLYYRGERNAVRAKYELLREETVELKITHAQEVSELRKQLKQRVVETEKRPDGTLITKETDTQENLQENKTTVTSINSSRYSLVDRETETQYAKPYPWELEFSYGKSFTAGDTYKLGVSRDVLERFEVGGFV